MRSIATATVKWGGAGFARVSPVAIASTASASSSAPTPRFAPTTQSRAFTMTPSPLHCPSAAAPANDAPTPSTPAPTLTKASAQTSDSSTSTFYDFRTNIADKTAATYRPTNVSVSQRCYDNIKRVNRLEGLSCADRFLRLSIESGGCQGFSYKFDFDTEASDAYGKQKAAAGGGGAAVVEEDDVDDVADIRFYPPVATSSEEAVATAQGELEKNVPFVVVDTETLKKLSGATLDYHSELKGSAFVVIGNELVDHSCACAMSFAIKSPAK